MLPPPISKKLARSSLVTSSQIFEGIPSQYSPLLGPIPHGSVRLGVVQVLMTRHSKHAATLQLLGEWNNVEVKEPDFLLVPSDRRIRFGPARLVISIQLKKETLNPSLVHMPMLHCMRHIRGLNQVLNNNCTRYTWVYGLKTKSAECVIDALWSFFLDAGCTPQRIWCDFDASFVKVKVHKFLTMHKVQIASSPPKRQSQNGLVERQWQTAIRMGRALLIDTNLPRRYWLWALREAVIRMNIMSCKPQRKPTTTTPKPAKTQSTPTLPQSTKVAEPAKANKPPSELTTWFELFHKCQTRLPHHFQMGFDRLLSSHQKEWPI
jgi:hypothetical protein